jgi:hypothetical protein
VDRNESTRADPIKLAKFLTPIPRPRSSVPPAPDPEALRQPPVPATADERTSLFSDLPVPRKNSSLRPPPEGADAPRATAPLGGFEENERRITEAPVEQDLLDEEPDDDELDFVPLSDPLVGRDTARRVAIALSALVAIAVVAIAARRIASPRATDVSPASSPRSSIATASSAPAAEALEPTADDLADSDEDVETGRELRREARQVLQRGNAQEGVVLARRAIQADPNNAEGYILLAAGLQDLGHWQESHDVFAKCVQESNRKANAECVYFATRSK